MGKPTSQEVSHTEYIGMRGEPGELNISVARGKDINRDCESSGERNRRSLLVIAHDLAERSGRPATEGDSPVREKTSVVLS